MREYIFKVNNTNDFVNLASSSIKHYLREYYSIDSNYMSFPQNVKQEGNEYSCLYNIVGIDRNLLILCKYITDTNYLTIETYNQDASHKVSLKRTLKKDYDDLVEQEEKNGLEILRDGSNEYRTFRGCNFKLGLDDD